MKTLAPLVLTLAAAASALSAPALAQPAPAAKPACDVKATVTNLQKAGRAGAGYAVTGDTCTALRQVLERLFGSSVSGGWSVVRR